MDGAASSLLTVKFAPPATAPSIERRHLVERLLGNAATSLTLLSAPVGWGKTSVVRSWLDDPRERRAVSWLTLDSDDDEPTRFWRYVTTAVQRALPEVGAVALGALAVPGADPIVTAVPSLLNDLAECHGRAVLVLDDYHVIQDPLVHETLEYLVTYLPPSLRLVITSRLDPPLPLPRMRARGLLTELRAADLRLTTDEVAELVAETLGREVDPDLAGVVADRTEGWAAAVRLAALAVRGSADPLTQLASLPADHWHLTDLLTSEVLDDLDPATEDALVRTSILRRLSVPLCGALIGRELPGGWLEDLERSSLPIVALDHRREWYRLHPLVREVLAARCRSRSSSTEVAELHRRAAGWFEDRGDDDAAFGHQLAAGDGEAAATLLLDAVPRFRRRGATATLVRLGERLPEATLRGRPALAMQLAWANGLAGRHHRARELADLALAAADASPEVGDQVGGDWASVRSSWCALQVSFTYVTDPEEALRLAEEAVAAEADAARRGYALARAALGLARTVCGDIAGANRAFEAALGAGSAVEPTQTLTIAGLLASNLYASGDLSGAEGVLERWSTALADLEARVGSACAAATVTLRLVAGQLARHRGGLEVAAAELERAVAAGRQFGVAAPLCDALIALAEVRHLGGDRRTARRLVEEARQLATEGAIPADVRELVERADASIGRDAQRWARREGSLVEPLTDRELSILRAMQGDGSLRDLAGELYLSLNTVKGYARILYRKLGVNSRADAIERGRELGLI